MHAVATMAVIPKQADEFTCMSRFLVQHRGVSTAR
jgi:hypothetical protein